MTAAFFAVWFGINVLVVICAMILANRRKKKGKIVDIDRETYEDYKKPWVKAK